jgi:tetratricopeptide (TPR) repeat protein
LADNLLGLLLVEDGKAVEAIPAYERSIRLGEELARADPGRVEHQAQLAIAWFNKGVALGRLGREGEAVAALAEATKYELRSLAMSPSGTTAQMGRDLKRMGGRPVPAVPPSAPSGDDTGAAAGLAIIDEGRALAGVRDGRWGQAAAHLARLVERKPDDARLRYEHGLALRAAGDLEGYRRACDDALRRFEGTTNAEAAFLVGRLCGVGGDSGVDPARVVALEERAVASGPRGPRLYGLGLGHYRAGQFDRAVQRLDEARKVDPGWQATCLNWVVLAMAHHRLGHREQAQAWLRRAVELEGRARPITPEGGVSSRFKLWWDWIEFRLLLREAEAILDPGRD